MNNDSLTERRAWFRHFPEGNVEFIMVARVLIVGAMGATALLRGTQWPLGSIGLLGLICADYLMQTWWFVQVKCDLQMSLGRAPASAHVAGRVRVITSLLASLPAIIALLLIAPWPDVVIRNPDSRESLMRVVEPVIGVLFVAATFVALQALRRIRLADHVTLALWLMPVAHVFLAQRLMRIIQSDIRRQRQEQKLALDDEPQSGGIFIAANVLGVLMLIPWAIIIRTWGAGGNFQEISTGRLLVLAGTILTAVFSTVQIASLENLQKQFVGLVQGKQQE